LCTSAIAKTAALTSASSAVLLVTNFARILPLICTASVTSSSTQSASSYLVRGRGSVVGLWG